MEEVGGNGKPPERRIRCNGAACRPGFGPLHIFADSVNPACVHGIVSQGMIFQKFPEQFKKNISLCITEDTNVFAELEKCIFFRA